MTEKSCFTCNRCDGLGPEMKPDSICWNCSRCSEWEEKVEVVVTTPDQVLRDRGAKLNKKLAETPSDACCANCKYEGLSSQALPCRECFVFEKWLPEECLTLSEELDGGPAITGSFLDMDDFESNDKVSNIIPDSGQRRTFATGSVRDIRVNKGRYDLMSPFALFRYARRMEDGATKYGHRNWEKGQELMSYLDSCVRHIFKYIWLCMTGQPVDEDHPGAALWNIAAFIHTQEMIRLGKLPAELDDIPGGGQHYEDKEPKETEEA